MNDYDPDEPQDPGDGLSDARPNLRRVAEWESLLNASEQLVKVVHRVEQHIFYLCRALDRRIYYHVPFVNFRHN